LMTIFKPKQANLPWGRPAGVLADPTDPDLEVAQNIPTENPQDSGDLGYSLIAGSNAFVGLQQVKYVTAADEHLGNCNSRLTVGRFYKMKNFK
jgi:hypothetical protein